MVDGSSDASTAANELATMKAITHPASDSNSRTKPRVMLNSTDKATMARTT